ncbi:uncharacterized protein LOC134970349 isoform X2 [Pseudophryne corroboree]|uniref:uncharacterized protein LOC134970349 isoform X2 n=1 Tax=Pseudophryne corroboree TaxID=495146 RepID=UPI00308205E5
MGSSTKSTREVVLTFWITLRLFLICCPGTAKPDCVLSVPELELNPGAEKSVTCYVRHYYPGSVDVHWVKYSKGPSEQYALDSDTCITVPDENEDGTFNVTNKLSVRPKSRREDGEIYSCIVTHRSLSTRITANFTLSVREADIVPTVLGTCIPIFLLLLIVAATGLCLWYKKEIPEVSSIAATEFIELSHMKKTTLSCHISGFRPKALDIGIFLQRVADMNRREIYTWNSINSVRASPNTGNVSEPLLERGSINNNKPLQLYMETIMSSTKQGKLFSHFSCQCSIHITPTFGTDDGALLEVEVKHTSLKEPVCRQVRLKVIGAPPILSSIIAPQYQRHGDHVNLTCRMTKFYPEKIHVTWVKEDLLMHKAPLVMYEGDKKYEAKYEVKNESDNETVSCSLFSTLGFIIDVKDDHGVKYICRVKHLATNHTAQSDMEMYVTAEPVLDPVQSNLNGDQMELSCRIHSFHPQHLQVTWCKENEVLSSTETVANTDNRGLFYVTSSVTYTVRLEDFGRIFKCKVDHQSSCPRSVEWKLEQAGEQGKENPNGDSIEE